MMTLAMGQAEQEAAAAKVVAHQPLEKKTVMSRGFAASGAAQQ